MVRRRPFTEDFEILQPPLSGSVTSFGSDNSVYVVVEDDGANETFFARILECQTGTPTTIGSTQLVGSGVNIYANFVPAGNIPTGHPGSNNKTVFVRAFKPGSVLGVSHARDFIAFRLEQHVLIELVKAHPQAIVPEVQLAPVAVVLTVDSPVRPGACSYCDVLNKPTRLLHSRDLSDANCWYSEPLEFCADGAAPGWWILQQRGECAWTLELRHDDATLVHYRLTMSQDERVFPLRLQLVGQGSKKCKNWPKSVTITPEV